MYSASELLQIARTGFKEIGYHDDLLINDYSFADFMSPSTPVRQIPLAGFAQHPPSYRSSGFGVLIANGVHPSLPDFIALGAPHLFVLHPSRNEVYRWKVHAIDPELVEVIEGDNLLHTIRDKKEEWGPSNVLRAKSISIQAQDRQLDFYDIGLLPVLEHEVHTKLDELFQKTFTAAIQSHAELQQTKFTNQESESLFRLVFRLVAAKLLADRKYPGEWLYDDVQEVLDKVKGFYFRTIEPEKISLDQAIQQLVWDEIRQGFRLQNLSLEALAYVYENTFVTDETRAAYDTHATPPEIAEYIVRQLPFETITSPNQRTIFEPFTGHAPFLTASLGRLRTLLPAHLSTLERHDYFIKMLSGIELDSFAREVAHYSLILADYPNPNGWNIEQADVFKSPQFNQLLSQANIVLCNPPFGNFGEEERKYYDLRSVSKAVETLLRVLENPPQMLGFLLPLSFADGSMYKTVRKRLAEQYGNISITALPDDVFRYSEIETVILLAHERASQNRRWQRIFVHKNDYDQFWQTGKPTWQDIEVFEGSIEDEPKLWVNPVKKNIFEHLKDSRRLGEIAKIHRGIEYKEPVEKFVSDTPKPGHERGLQRIKDGLEPYLIRGNKYLNNDSNNMRTKAYLLPWNKAKVIANAARTGRDLWRIIASSDENGLLFYQRFLAIWPINNFSLDVITAILNGPVANILLSSPKRDNLIKNVEEIPVPVLSKDDIALLGELIQKFRSLRTDASSVSENALNALMAQIDLLILSGYNLPSWLEDEIIDYIGYVQRPPLRTSLVDQLRARYAELVDKKFIHVLSNKETDELQKINRLLDAAEAQYYKPIKEALLSTHAAVLNQLIKSG